MAGNHQYAITDIAVDIHLLVDERHAFVVQQVYLVEHNRAQYADPSSLIRAMGEMMAFIGYPEKRDRLFKALDFCTKVERKAVITTDKDGATAEEFAEYVVETLHKMEVQE